MQNSSLLVVVVVMLSSNSTLFVPLLRKPPGGRARPHFFLSEPAHKGCTNLEFLPSDFSTPRQLRSPAIVRPICQDGKLIYNCTV